MTVTVSGLWCLCLIILAILEKPNILQQQIYSVGSVGFKVVWSDILVIILTIKSISPNPPHHAIDRLQIFVSELITAVGEDQ